MNNRLILGGILSIALLGLYVYSISKAITVSNDCAALAKAVADKVPFATLCDPQKSNLGNVSLILNLIGGLISATVVGVLAATKPNDLPGRGIFKDKLGNVIQGLSAYIPLAFVLAWIFCGLVMVIFGLLVYDSDPVPPLTAQAKSWLGAAVAAGYAYFGVDQTNAPIPSAPVIPPLPTT